MWPLSSFAACMHFGQQAWKQRQREIRHEQHDAESSHRGSSLPMFALLLCLFRASFFRFGGWRIVRQDFADPSSPDKRLRPLPAMASAKSLRFRFSFLGTNYGVRGGECDGAPPCLAAPPPPKGMSSARHSWCYWGIRYQHTDSQCLQQKLDTDLPTAKARRMKPELPISFGWNRMFHAAQHTWAAMPW